MSHPVDILWASSGFAVADRTFQAITALQHGDPLREVVILAPPGATAGTLRRRLAHAGGGRGVAGVRFTTAVDYAFELSPAAIRARRPITPQLLGAAVRQQLNDHCPPELEPVKDHRSTLDALVQAAERLRNVSLATDSESIVRELAGTNRTRTAIATVARRARRVVTDAGFRDEPTLLRAATGAAATAALPPLVIVLSECFHPGQIPFIVTLARSAPAVMIVALVPEHDDDALRAQIEAIAGAGSIDDVVPATLIPVPGAVTSCPDQDEEIRQVVRAIVAAVTDGRQPAHRIAVLHPGVDGYARGLADELDRAGIAWTGPAPGQLSASIAGQAMRFLLDCLDSCDRVNVFHLLDVAPLWPSQRASARPIVSWQATCREIGLVTERDWSSALERLQRQQDGKRQRFGDQNITRDEQATRRLQQLLDLVGEITRARSALRSAKTWTGAARHLTALLQQHVGTEPWRQQHWAGSQGETEGVRSWQVRAAAQITQLISGLATLDDPALPVRYSYDDLAPIVSGLLDRPLGREGDPTAGVRLLHLAHGLCIDADLVFVVGANDGVLPPAASEDLLIRRDISAVCARWIEPADWHTRRSRRAWAALLRGPATVAVSYARSDLRRGGLLYPSEWLQGIGDHRQHTSHAQGLSDGPHLSQAELILAEPDPTARYRHLRRRALAVRSRLQPEPTEFDGQVGAHPALAPAGNAQSITRFETLATCGISYLLTYALGVKDLTDPAEITSIEPMDRGNLVHAVMETLVQEWLDAPPPRPGWLGPGHFERCLRRAGELIDEGAHLLDTDSRLGHPATWRIERSLMLTAVELTLHGERDLGVTPVAAEHAFGSRDGHEPFRVDTSVGEVQFQGKIDRIDRIADGLLVTDFKTSSSANPKAQAPKAADPTKGGTKLQLPLYAAVAQRDFDPGTTDVHRRHARYVFLGVSGSTAVALPAGAHEQFGPHVDMLAQRLHSGDLRAGAPDLKWGCKACSPDKLGLEAVALRASWWGFVEDEE